MVWDKYEITILLSVLLIGTYLTAIGKFESSTMENAVSVIIGYATGRIFNQATGKE